MSFGMPWHQLGSILTTHYDSWEVCVSVLFTSMFQWARLPASPSLFPGLSPLLLPWPHLWLSWTQWAPVELFGTQAIHRLSPISLWHFMAHRELELNSRWLMVSCPSQVCTNEENDGFVSWHIFHLLTDTSLSSSKYVSNYSSLILVVNYIVPEE